MDVTLEMEVQGIQPHRRDQVIIGDNLEGDQHSQAAELLEDQDNLEEYQPCRWEAVEPLEVETRPDHPEMEEQEERVHQARQVHQAHRAHQEMEDNRIQMEITPPAHQGGSIS